VAEVLPKSFDQTTEGSRLSSAVQIAFKYVPQKEDTLFEVMNPEFLIQLFFTYHKAEDTYFCVKYRKKWYVTAR